MSTARVVFQQYDASGEPLWLLGEGLARVVETCRNDEILAKLAEVEKAVDGGLYAAGFLSYEAASGIDADLCTHAPGPLPLLWFGLYREMVAQREPPLKTGSGFSLGDWTPSVSTDQYQRTIVRIKDYIAQGDTYQVNYTFRLRAAFAGDPWAFFQRLAGAQRASYAAYIDMGRHVLCSASPELFFSMAGDLVVSRPMKGTCARGLTVQEDAARRRRLLDSEKDRAENAMIVDMMRNDIGRIARPGSIQVRWAFDVEKYPTVFQMTSTVEGRTGASLVDVFHALFPAASITGAPKIRTMQIIRELEADPRGVYTGAIGYWGPGRQARFSVAIRTAVIDRAAGLAEYGVGGGVVWDSRGADEYAECLAKAAVLSVEMPTFELLETILYEGRGGYFLLEEHLARLAQSAQYFDYAVDLAAVRRALEEQAAGMGDVPHRVRLRVNRQGRPSVEATGLSTGDPAVPWRLRLAERPVDSGDLFLYHKTTWRRVYDSARQSQSDCDDLILWNEHGHLTETTIANLVVEIGGRLLTPPVECGLLAGVFREHLLETGQVHQHVLTIDDLRRADRVFAVNSIRKWVPAVVLGLDQR